MATLDYRTTCELNRPITIKHLDGMFFSQDVQANRIVVSVVRGGVNENLSGTVSANIIRADGATVAQTGEISGNIASVTMPAAAYAVPGAIAVFVKHTENGVTSTLAAVTGYVYKSTTDTIVDPGTIIPSIQDLLESIDDAIEDLEEAIAAIPQDYQDLEDDVADLKNEINVLEPVATSSDVGKILIVKTVENNKVTEYEFGETGEGWTPAMKEALLQCFQHVEWDDEHGQEYYNDLYNALYPPVSISALFDSSHPVTISDTLDSLRPYIVVTAHYNGSQDRVVTDYTLSGSLNVGDNIITVAFVGLSTTITVTATADSNVVDVCLFAGQSNMDGRGDASEAPVVTAGTAYKWDASNNAVVDFTAENSLIPAFVKTYYEEMGVPIVEVKKAEGGVTIDFYINTYLTNALTQLQNCITYLENNSKTVRHVFMLWNQGESDVDGDGNTGTAAYEASFETLRTAALAAGVEEIFIINIGQASNGNFDFAPIRTALQDVCNGTNTFMVCDKYYNATQYMKDRWHYNQIVYNVVGAKAAENINEYFKTGIVPAIIPFDASDVWGVPAEYGTLTDWTYQLHYTKVLLKSYTGSGGAVHVYHMYKVGDMYYEARLSRPRGSGYNNEGTFFENDTITSLTIAANVKYMNPNGMSDGLDVQGASGTFRKMTECISISGIPASYGQGDCFRDCAKLESFAPADFIVSGTISYAFSNTKIPSVGNLNDISNIISAFTNNTALTMVGNINGTYTSGQGSFQNCSNLETVGVFGSTAMTSINSMFLNCTKLNGIVKFMSPNISAASNAFYNCDLTQIEIQVPANSTTYTTITTAYPNANVTTF